MEEFSEPVTHGNRPPSRTAAWFKSEAALRTADLIAGAAVIALIFWWLQYSTTAICCGDYDGYYHIKWARLIWDNLRAGHFPPPFPWLPLTTLNPGNYVDHHLLYHIILIPFTWFRDLQTGAKLSAILFASIAVFSCYWLIVRYEIRYRLVWLLAIVACSAPFLYRMNMAKAPPFAIIFLIVGTYLLFEKRFWPLLPLAFVFTLTYDLFVLLMIAALVWTIVVGWSEERFEWRPLVFVFAGIALGLIINPYFPHNLYLFYEHARMKITASGFATKVGQEWYPYDTAEFVVNCYVALAAMLVGYIAFDFSDRKRAQRPLFFLVFATLLLLMNARWKRFAEYFPPLRNSVRRVYAGKLLAGAGGVYETAAGCARRPGAIFRSTANCGSGKGQKDGKQLAVVESQFCRGGSGRRPVRQRLSDGKGHTR